MKNTFARFVLVPLAFYLLSLVVIGASCQQVSDRNPEATEASFAAIHQVADPDFDPTVTHPAYMEEHPQVLFDEAHFNFHTTTGRYRPFVDLITNDGYQVAANKTEFTKRTFEGYDILVIANAMGANSMSTPQAGTPAFTEEECDAVRDWVFWGGSLLLIADHPPFGAAAEDLAHRFDVEMSNAWTTDESNSDLEWSPRILIFTRDNGLLADHPITQGQTSAERIDRVITFAGQSLKGPDTSIAFLTLAETAVDLPHLDSRKGSPAGGRAQGIALNVGKGRVVVLGEAAMLSAQLYGERPMGMNRAGYDNRQLVLNIMHWLSGLLK